MSFSQEIKSELCRHPLKRPCCALAELYGVLLLCNTFDTREIRVVTASAAFAKRLPLLFEKAGVAASVKRAEGGKHTLTIADRATVAAIFTRLNYDPATHVSLHLNGWLLEKDCCRGAFLRGMFLANGFAVSPEKKYHLELMTPHAALSREISALLSELDLKPKSTVRQGNHVIYMKESENIEDFLTLSGAPVAAMRMMDAKALKDIRNNVNRRVNFETANLMKTVDAAGEQAEAIRLLASLGRLEALEAPLRAAASLRLEHPEATLSELAALSEPAVSKSGLNHRLRKLVTLAKEARPG